MALIENLQTDRARKDRVLQNSSDILVILIVLCAIGKVEEHAEIILWYFS
jgi:hypothetical protein